MESEGWGPGPPQHWNTAFTEVVASVPVHQQLLLPLFTSQPLPNLLIPDPVASAGQGWVFL